MKRKTTVFNISCSDLLGVIKKTHTQTEKREHLTKKTFGDNRRNCKTLERSGHGEAIWLNTAESNTNRRIAKPDTTQ